MAGGKAAGSITWLASYPKSGNTWVRALLSSYLAGGTYDLSINHLVAPYVTAGRSILEEHLGVESSDLLPIEIERLRPRVYKLAASKAAEPLIWKTHDAWRLTDRGESLFPACVCGPAVYIARNPLDVAVSFANHQGWSLENTVRAMSNPEYCLRGDRYSARGQLYEFLGRWDDHVRSWLEQNELDVMLVRYEDLHADPFSAFTAVLLHLKIPVERKKVALAIEQSSFRHLRAQEEQAGFTGKNPAGGRFFRRGEIGAWRDELASELVEQLQRDHGEVMARLGYADIKLA